MWTLPAVSALVLCSLALVLAAPANEGSTGSATAATLSPSPSPAATLSPSSTPTPSPSPTPPVNTHEEPCLRQGGLCLPQEQCPAGQLSEKRGLCPQQQDRGVECCHGLSELERRCSARGGVCRPKHKCGRQLWEEKGEDCAAGETCCILVT